ncbi:hypothetical protein GCM10010123_44330 [Pilimelia anulata]|uniref:DNA primase/polymerase bifunctional N-terminal domain-containing protein n=1 Tax=Pilimelia anulata TaxID=53371 RepID=A0A8J3BEQ2_9ACTN|nr:bifunctional DNA primase/polymerase [Pilimelia anulata]GGK09578.1 hypothetical protein GCM10010123_44330 [Pilimelia anulata]
MTGTPLLAAALDYAGRGWPVFLLGRRKRPVGNCRRCRGAGPGHDRTACGCLTCHGPYAATVDPDRIAALFTAVPGGLLALATGAGAGLVVADIDPRHGGRVDPTLMFPTAHAVTGSGGLHLYYRHPGVPVLNSQSRVAAGVDIRGEGGYVVAPPSIHPDTGRPYRWVPGRGVDEMPPPLLDACTRRPAVPVVSPAGVAPPTPATHRGGGGGISSPHRLLTAHLDAVARAPAGRRRTTLYGAARGVARMVAAAALTPNDAVAALTAAGRGVGQPERDIRNAITGGFRDEGVTL